MRLHQFSGVGKLPCHPVCERALVNSAKFGCGQSSSLRYSFIGFRSRLVLHWPFVEWFQPLGSTSVCLTPWTTGAFGLDRVDLRPVYAIHSGFPVYCRPLPG